MRRTGLARGQGMKLAVSSAPKARKVFISHPRVGRRALLGIQAAHLPCAKWSFWWVIFREQTWVTSRERRSEENPRGAWADAMLPCPNRRTSGAFHLDHMVCLAKERT